MTHEQLIETILEHIDELSTIGGRLASSQVACFQKLLQQLDAEAVTLDEAVLCFNLIRTAGVTGSTK